VEIPLRVLIVEDSKEDAELLLEELRRGGFDLVFKRVDSSQDMVNALENQSWDIIFSDYTMPQFTGMEALARVVERECDVPFIFVSGTIGEDTAVAAMKAGAHDYIMKGNLKRLLPLVKRELEEATGRRERKQAEERVHYLAFHDVLTDLPNRTLFYDHLHQNLLTGRREGQPSALLLLDLNRFKEINDTFGHHYGDLLLRQIGPRLRRCLRETDTVARMGGDEFAILLPNTHLKGANSAARKILKTFETPFTLKETNVEVGASIGVAFFPDHGEEEDLLFQRADTAMYVAKQAGGGYAVYSPLQEHSHPGRLMLRGRLRHAIEHEELELYYQPLVNLRTNRIIGVEALSRWPDRKLGWIPPDQFIPLAEQTGLIKPFTQWVLKSVCRQFEEWKKLGLSLSISVNLSARNLQEARLPDRIGEFIQAGSIPPGLLEFEITESMIMVNPMRAIEVLTRLNALGIPLALDDFGTGYSSLSYLKKLPVQKIKIDKSFIIDLESKGDVVIVRSIINMGHSLGLDVVAEGVEDQHTKDLMEALGCDVVQGNHISVPIPSEDLTLWLQGSPWIIKEHP
jgi:diguanylate cyclase (GGDEF)-like protein